MKPTDRHRSMAHLWLFSAGLDPDALDSAGDTLAVSLAKRFAAAEGDGRREAARHHWIAVSDEFEDEPTQPYPDKRKPS